MEGIDNWDIANSSKGLTKYLFPNENFLIQYSYVEGDYHYYDNCNSLDRLETVIAVIKYESDIYLDAKKYCIDNFYLSQNNIKEYNGYFFTENLNLPKSYKNVEDGKNIKFPYYMNMFGYNDSQSVLVFIGLYCNEALYEKAALVHTDFGSFLKAFYSQYYDFDKH